MEKLRNPKGKSLTQTTTKFSPGEYTHNSNNLQIKSFGTNMLQSSKNANHF